MSDMQIQATLRDETIREAIHAKLMEALDGTAREAMIQGAIGWLTCEAKYGDGESNLERIFTLAIQEQTRAMIADLVRNDVTISARIEELIREVIVGSLGDAFRDHLIERITGAIQQAW